MSTIREDENALERLVKEQSFNYVTGLLGDLCGVKSQLAHTVKDKEQAEKWYAAQQIMKIDFNL